MLVFWKLRAMLLCTKRSSLWLLFVAWPPVMRGCAEMGTCQKQSLCLSCSHWRTQVCQISYCFVHAYISSYDIMVLWYYIYGPLICFLNSLFLCSFAHGPQVNSSLVTAAFAATTNIVGCSRWARWFAWLWTTSWSWSGAHIAEGGHLARRAYKFCLNVWDLIGAYILYKLESDNFNSYELIEEFRILEPIAIYIPGTTWREGGSTSSALTTPRFASL